MQFTYAYENSTQNSTQNLTRLQITFITKQIYKFHKQILCSLRTGTVQKTPGVVDAGARTNCCG